MVMARRIKTLSQRHEHEYAAMVPHTIRTIASGAILDKYDARSEKVYENRSWRFRSELKCTQRKGFRITSDQWREINEYALLHGERPLLAIRFYGPGPEEDAPVESVPVVADLVVMDLADFVELVSELERLRGQGS